MVEEESTGLPAARSTVFASGLSSTIAKKPDGPGRWLQTRKAGQQRIFRVRSQNGELYVISGWLLPVATPVADVAGYWVSID